jgi:hypothetical protein
MNNSNVAGAPAETVRSSPLGDSTTGRPSTLINGRLKDVLDKHGIHWIIGSDFPDLDGSTNNNNSSHINSSNSNNSSEVHVHSTNYCYGQNIPQSAHGGGVEWKSSSNECIIRAWTVVDAAPDLVWRCVNTENI